MFKLKNEKPRITAAIFFEIIVLPIVKLYQSIIRIKSLITLLLKFLGLIFGRGKVVLV